VFTDAAVAAPVLQQLLTEGTETSFNCVTVDGDTSTSDTLLLFATGKAGGRVIESAEDPALQPFREALHGVLIELAQLVARDGEGARKFVTIEVAGAESDRSAHRIAMSIANSPLVKTAIAGQDANWGRVVMAVGKAGEPADRDRLAISFGDVRVAVDGARDPDYSEEAASDVMRKDEITVRVDLGLGDGSARVWTCDLTKAYVEINGDYRS
jgi:glutamate N-acetyltransferase/amino-acid N-acetyltransferase